MNVGDTMSTSEMFSTSEGYHEYIRGISRVHRGMFSASEGIMIHVGEQLDKILSISVGNSDDEDVDLMLLEWEWLFLKILDRHAPIRQRKVRNNYAPHINSDLRRKMFLRDYYKKKHRFTKSENDWQQYE